MKYTILAFVFAVILSACGNKSKDATTETPSNTITLTEQKVFKHTGDCENEHEPCALVDMKLFHAEGTNSKCLDSLNHLLQQAAMQCAMIMPDSAGNLNDINAVAAEYIKSYEEFHKEFPDAPGSWEARSNMKLLFQNDSLLSIITDGYNYSGGAHPNSFTDIIVYDKINCKRLTSSEMFKQSGDLMKLVEKHFRTNRAIPDGQSLNAFGFFFEDDSFVLPANIGLEKDSILFMFNDYEVGPHVLGPSEFRISKSELLPHLKLKY